VVFLGRPNPRLTVLMAGLSPALLPVPLATWGDLADQAPGLEPDLVAVLPGTDSVPPFPWSTPVQLLDEEDLDLSTPEFESHLLLADPKPTGAVHGILGCSPAISRVRGLLADTGPTDLPLLLSGENGTGKDLAAKVAHGHSSRAAHPFVAVNCGAIPAALAETELFGCVRGAFTGAENRSGYCQQALGGTLFLDEVGELPLELQAKLLRALENREVRRVGSCRVETVDFRLICATNRNLSAEVAGGKFREDLYYRINVLPLKIPALRERKEDIPILARHFLASEASGIGRKVRLSPRALAKLADYHWPGNLRQLRNVVLRAAVLHPGRELGPEHITWDS
jgi:transcriptional regulator with PAS, ATPase and Fis domain